MTLDSNCSHVIKRHLLLGRKAMTNLDSILKSRDITLLTKFRVVKAIVFPVLCWRRLLRVPWTASRSNQSILKEISPEYSLEGLLLKLKLQYLGHLIQRANSLEKILMPGETEGRRRRRWQRMRWLDWHHWLCRCIWANSGDSEGQGSLACCSS